MTWAEIILCSYCGKVPPTNPTKTAVFIERCRCLLLTPWYIGVWVVYIGAIMWIVVCCWEERHRVRILG